MIPASKAELVNKLVLKRTPLPLHKFTELSDWLYDVSLQDSNEIDYMLILYNLRKYAKADGFFCRQAHQPQKNVDRMDETYINMLADASG